VNEISLRKWSGGIAYLGTFQGTMVENHMSWKQLVEQ